VERIMTNNSDIQESGKRELLLEGALKVFSEKGFHGATVEEVAEVAGVGKGTVYLYFGSKTDLFVSVVEEKLKELKGVVKDRLKDLEGARAKLAESIKLHWEFFNQSREFVKVILSDLSGLERELDERTREARAGFIGVIESVIEEGIMTGEFKDVEPRMAAYAIEGAISFVAFENLVNDKSSPSIPDASQLVDFCLCGLCRLG
jgi:TetR/AcrR family fatty acid metabolism transcriptional regulator